MLTGVYPLHLACESGYEGLGRVECRSSGEDFVFTGCTLSETDEESSNIVVWLVVGIGVVAAGGLARNKPWQKGKQKHWIEQIERFTPAEMKANVSTPPARLPRWSFLVLTLRCVMADQYEAKNNTISKSEELVFHFTSRESAELIIAKGSNGLRASQVRTPFPLLSAERLAVGA